MQVRQVVKALKGEDTAAHPPAANPAAVAATALLALSGVCDESGEGSSLKHHKHPRSCCLHCCCGGNSNDGGND